MDELKFKNESRDSVNLQGTILGSVLANPKKAGVVIANLDPGDFSDVMGTVFSAIRALYLDGDPIDAITVLHRIPDAEQGESELWPRLLEELRGRAVEDPLPYCRMLHECVVLGRMKGEALGVQYAEDLQSATEAATRLVGLLSNRMQMRRTTAQDAAFAFLERLDSGGQEFVEWGLDGLDEPSTHTALGDFVILGGYPSAGKSMLAAQLTQKLAEKYRVAYFSGEMSEQDITDRSLARMSGVPLDAILERRYTERQLRALAAATEKYYQLRFDVFESAGASVAKIEAETLAGRYQVIVVDYMQLLSVPGSSRYEKVTEISMGLHALARRHRVLVIALAQLARPDKPSKDAKPVPPSMSSFRESGQIEQDADLALLLYLDNPNDPKSQRVLKTAKNRKGLRNPKIMLDFHGETQLFTEAFPERPKPKPRTDKRRSGELAGQEEMET